MKILIAVLFEAFLMHKLKIKEFLFLFLLPLLFSCSSPDNKDTRPNIILIVTDDLGIGSLSCYNNQINNHTPNLDRLAEAGWQFDNLYVTSPVCSPSRVSMLTGLSPQYVQIEKVLRPGKVNESNGLLSSHVTFVSKLKEAGYQTTLIGKWHVGYGPKEHPLKNGFETFTGFLNGHIDYISHTDPNGKFNLIKDEKEWKPEPKKHLTEILTDEAIQLVKENKDSPYFLMLSYANPHIPILLPGEEALFPGSGKSESNTPERYKKMLTFFDKEIGKLMTVVNEQDDNTLVIFISDHGSPKEVDGNEPFSGGKGNLLEGGIKVPGIMYWPRKLTHKRINNFCTSMDLYSTILSAAKIPYTPLPGQAGKSLLDSEIASNDKSFLWEFNGVNAIRKNSWKAIFYSIKDSNERQLNIYLENTPAKPYEGWTTPNGEKYIVWLFNLVQDSTEHFNLAEKETEKVNELWNELEKISGTPVK